MSIPATLVSRPVTLDQLVALSDEIAALSRAGVPLDRGLLELSYDLPGRLGSLAGDIGRRLEAGESLAAIVAKSGAPFPPAYRAVIEAGQRVGRLPAAIESVAHAARRIRQLRTSIGTALIYPIVVLLVAWSLFTFTLAKLLPVMIGVLRDFDPSTAPPGSIDWQRFAETVGRLGTQWGWLVPLFMLAWLAWAWYFSDSTLVGEWHPLLTWGPLAPFARLQRAGRMAALTELLGLLVTHKVPLDEAVTLASAAVGTSRLAAGGRELAERIRRGQIGGRPPAGFSPLLAWTLTCDRGDQLGKMLLRSSQVYREEFNRRAQWLSLCVPLLATCLLGGSVVALYAVVSLGPWVIIMHRLASPFLE